MKEKVFVGSAAAGWNGMHQVSCMARQCRLAGLFVAQEAAEPWKESGEGRKSHETIWRRQKMEPTNTIDNLEHHDCMPVGRAVGRGDTYLAARA